MNTTTMSAATGDRTGPRLLTAAVLFVVVTTATGVWGSWTYGPVAGWLTGATVFLTWTWRVIGPMSPTATAGHATREDPTRSAAHAVLVTASIASLAGVGYLLTLRVVDRHSTTAIAAGLSLASVLLSWCTINTLFTLRYAAQYYRKAAADIDFNQPLPPAYADFAYLAFTIGMTYQVSDTNLKSPAIRSSVLRHALLSYLLGAIVLATAVNLVAGLSGR